MSNGLFNFLSNIFNGVGRQVAKCQRIIDSGKKETSVSFAIWAIVNAVFSVAFIVGGVLLFAAAIKSSNIVFIIGGVLLGFALSVSGIPLLVNAIACVVNQLRLNRKAIGYVALVLVIILIVGGVVLGAVLLNEIKM